MADLGAYRRGIQVRLATIDGLHAYELATGAERMPCAIVFPKSPGGTFKETNCGDKVDYIVEIHVNPAQGMNRAQDQLDDLISTGAGSVEAAILADKTLGGAVNTTVVYAFTTYRFAELNKTPTIMAQVPVEVHT